VARHIVVAFRMPPAGMSPGPEGAYLARARSMCARGEALGGRLVAWSAALLAMSWDPDSIEEALLLASSIREESLSPERAWCGGMAEGELEPLAPDGQRMQLAWGEALLAAASLARIARSGELLVDGDLRALRAGQLSLLGARAATDAGQRVRGWRIDLEHPWKRGAETAVAGADATDRYLVVPSVDGPGVAADVTDTTQEMPVADFTPEELAAFDVLDIVDAASAVRDAPPSDSPARSGNALADSVRKIARAKDGSGAVDALAELRRAAARAERGPPAARCQAILALAIALAIAGRREEALLEALDALARARETHEAKAVGACMAVLAKLYSAAGFAGEATALRESSGAA
jgi:hypothetical protein